MDTIPNEIFNEIFKNLKTLEPEKLYRLRRVNNNFKNKIDNLKENYDINYVENNIRMQNILNKLFWSCNSISLFKWFFQNNIFLNENNMTNLIINKRLDILNECIKYNYLLDVIFKDSYNFLDYFPSSKIVIEKSPLILAGQTDQLDIIKFLLNTKIFKNPFYHQIDILINECIKRRNIRIIKFIVTEYYNYIKVKSETIENIIKKMSNIEDLIFYLVLSNKCIVTSKIVYMCINKRYINICKYMYEKFYINSLINADIHIRNIIKNDLLELLDHFFLLFQIRFIY